MEKKHDSFVLKDAYVGKYFIEQATIDGLGEVFIIKLNEKKT